MDRGSVQFTGKVRQAAAGDVINKAPQYNNSVNVNIAPSAAPHRSGQVLTNQQKKVLGELVEKIAEEKKCVSLDVWRSVLARSGAEKVKEIPIEEYVSLESFLREELAEVSLGKPLPTPVVITSNPQPLAPTPIEKAIEQVPLMFPSAAQHHNSPAKLSYFLAGGSFLVAVASGAAALDSKSQLEQLSSNILNARHNCQFAGQPYSQGSVISHASGPMRCEIEADDPEGTAHWVSTDTAKGKRIR